MSIQDTTLECSDCNNSFTFSAEEQEQFLSRGYTNHPKRCPECRQVRKSERYGNGGSSYRNSSNSYTPGRQFPAVCADCGKLILIPFEPSRGRPVYCSDCYCKVRVSR